jgi:hypothetical protein
MTERFGVSNITYRQADILKLGALQRRFTLIDCSGVLHHLDDPMQGWRILIDLMEPDGLMKVGLYSATARQGISAAAELVRSMDFQPTPDGIRRARRAIMALPDEAPAKAALVCGDFFTLNGCRDLLMHVREHQFTLPRIAECLDDLGLRFLGMQGSAEVQRQFLEMFPDTNAVLDLDAWDRFEQAFPATFIGMYSFWCCRKEA